MLERNVVHPQENVQSREELRGGLYRERGDKIT